MPIEANLCRCRFPRQKGNAGLAIDLGVMTPNVFLNGEKAARDENPWDFIRLGFIGAGNLGESNF